jgi:methionyl-tRNA formyltransferase
MESLRIVFMGTPEFAVPSLEILVNHSKNIVGVVTAEDKPQGRGQKLVGSPLKEAALRHGLHVLQPPKLKAPEFIEELKSLKADVQVVVAFRMLPEVVWAMPSRGTFNLHASLLPQYRGAAPINWAIINGETETGVTTFFLQNEIDTGKIIYQEREPIHESDDVGSLYERLKNKGAHLVLKTVEAIERGQVPAVDQIPMAEMKHSPKIFKETCRINWDQPALNIRNFVRGLSPHPGAWTELHGKAFKIFKVGLQEGTNGAEPGAIETDQREYIHIKCKDGWISVLEFQPEGKRKMLVEEFFRGNKLILG